ncbi:MAG: hypothetical protein ACHREM_29100, partial [Polyangiales bacterium]
ASVDSTAEAPPPFDAGPVGVLQLSPANQVAFLDKTTGLPATVSYSATLTDGSGLVSDVTAGTAFTIGDPALGTFAGASFSSALSLPGGALGVTATVYGTESTFGSHTKLTLVNIRKTPGPTGARDFFFIEPYLQPPSPTSDVLKFSTTINKVDVAISMDTTGSMSGEMSNLVNFLTSSVIPGLQAAIPDVGIAIVDHKDTDDAAYGYPWCGADPWVVNVRQVITTDPSAAEAAASAMSAAFASGGCDTPEAQIASMQYILTGAGDGSLSPATSTHTPAAGTWGGVDFRPGAVPVVVEISDASWHDPSGGATLPGLQATFNSVNAKFVDVFIDLSGDGTGDSSIAQAQQLTDATSSFLPAAAFGGGCPNSYSQRSDGNCRLMFQGQSDGTGVDTSIVNAITAIAVGATYDITAVLSNDPANPGGVDATKFVSELVAMDGGSVPDGCPAHAAYDSTGGVKGYFDTFKAVTVGTPVCFQIIPAQNTFVKPGDSAQFFDAFIDMEGMPGSVSLGDRRTVLFLVPPAQ